MSSVLDSSTLPPLSVVVTTYRRAALLPEMLAAVLADPAASEIIVVSDASPDATPEVLQALAADEPRLRPLLLPENVGQSRARREGVLVARHERVVSLDDDVLVEPGCLTGHARRAADADVVAGYMPTRQPQAWQDPATHQYAERYEQQCCRWESGTSVLEMFWAGNFSFNRTDYLAATAGAELSVAYHEDQDLGLRLAAQGRVGLFDRTLRSEHRFVRDYPASLRDARASAVGRAALAAVHGQAYAPMTQQQHYASSRWPRRLVLRLSRIPMLRPALYAAAARLITVARWRRSGRLALGAAGFGWQMAFLDGLESTTR